MAQVTQQPRTPSLLEGVLGRILNKRELDEKQRLWEIQQYESNPMLRGPDIPGTTDRIPRVEPSMGLQPGYTLASAQGIPPDPSAGARRSKGIADSLLGGASGVIDKAIEGTALGAIQQPMGGTAADLAKMANPVPKSTGESLLAAIPFARVMEHAAGFLPRHGPKFIQEKIAPIMMRMVKDANKSGFEHMDFRQREEWWRDYIRRGVREPNGKVHIGEASELHDDIVSRLRHDGDVSPDVPLDEMMVIGGVPYERKIGDVVEQMTGALEMSAEKNIYSKLAKEAPTELEHAHALARSTDVGEAADIVEQMQKRGQLKPEPPPAPADIEQEFSKATRVTKEKIQPKAKPYTPNQLRMDTARIKADATRSFKKGERSKLEWAHKVIRNGARVKSQEAPGGYIFHHAMTGETSKQMMARLKAKGVKGAEAIMFYYGKPVDIQKGKQIQQIVSDVLSRQ